ncbi:ATP-binding cassette domain-containing protein [Paenibacillus sp. GCM10027626]|uniref:ATP-binding cassette domain-containing protein n=1 Tax=Paenibacillus sp. GCM10027626 TaxID=3273411 RepID=UPI00363D5772
MKDRSSRINITLVGTILLFIVAFGIMLDSFLALGNFINMGHQMAITALIAFAMTAVILAKGIDLSVGSALALAGIVGAKAYESGMPPVAALLIVILTGAAVGALNGILVTTFKISPFIATFGTMAMCKGAALSLSNAKSISIADPVMIWLGSKTFGSVPFSIIFTLVLLAVWWIVLNRTVLGRYIYATGGNDETTRASAISSKGIQFLTYLLSGTSAGIAAILLIGRVQSAQPLAGTNLQFDVITAVVIGGTLLSGGVGSVIGTMFGAILVTIIRTGLSFYGASQEIIYIVTGAMILLSVILYQPNILKTLRLSSGKSTKSSKLSAQSGSMNAQGRHSLRLRDIGKLYSGVRALQKVSFEISSGEVVALVGENGAGKSTLVKIMTGVITPEEGVLELDGQPISLSTPKAAREAGIGVIHQHYSLIPELTIYENLFIGREETTGAGVLKRSEMKRIAKRLLDEFEIPLQPESKVSSLTVGQMQLIEVLKATLGNPWLIIMDEPTSSLSKSESEKLYELIDKLKAKGVAIFFISHKMEELYKLCSRAVIMRDGEHVGDANLPETDEQAIITMMVGRSIESVFPYQPASPKKVVLDLEGIGDGERLKDASLQVREGEIVVLAGLMGAGRSEVLNVLFGITKLRKGSIRIFGKPVMRPMPKKMAALGLAYVPEDRHKSGFVPMFSIRSNMSLSWLRLKHRFGFIPLKEEAELVDDLIKKLNVRPADPDKHTINLSGGNQQKVVLGKWLATNPKILLLDDPTRGVDVGAKSEIHQLIAGLKSQGVAILMVSSELPEALGVADRIIVMHEGRSAGELEHGATENQVMHYALGMHLAGKKAE